MDPGRAPQRVFVALRLNQGADILRDRWPPTLQKRLPQDLRLVGITDMDEANARFLKEISSCRLTTPALR